VPVLRLRQPLQSLVDHRLVLGGEVLRAAGRGAKAGPDETGEDERDQALHDREPSRGPRDLGMDYFGSTGGGSTAPRGKSPPPNRVGRLGAASAFSARGPASSVSGPMTIFML